MKRAIVIAVAMAVLLAAGALGVASGASAELPHEAGRNDSKCAHWGYWTETFAPTEMEIFLAEVIGFGEEDLYASGLYDPKVHLRYYIGAGCTSWHLKAAKILAGFIVEADIAAYKGFYRDVIEDPSSVRYGLAHHIYAPTSKIPQADARRSRGKTRPDETLADIEVADTVSRFAPAGMRKWISLNSVWLPSCENMHRLLEEERADSYNTQERVWAVWQAAVNICEAHCLAQRYGVWLSWRPDDSEAWRLRCGERYGLQVPQAPAT